MGRRRLIRVGMAGLLGCFASFAAVAGSMALLVLSAASPVIARAEVVSARRATLILSTTSVAPRDSLGLAMTPEDMRIHQALAKDDLVQSAIENQFKDYMIELAALDEASRLVGRWIGHQQREKVLGVVPDNVDPPLAVRLSRQLRMVRVRRLEAQDRLNTSYSEGCVRLGVPAQQVAEFRRATHRRHLLPRNRSCPGSQIDLFDLGLADVVGTDDEESRRLLREYERQLHELLLATDDARRAAYMLAAEDRLDPRVRAERWAKPFSLEGAISKLNEDTVVAVSHFVDSVSRNGLVNRWRRAVYPFVWDHELEQLMHERADEAFIAQVRSFQRSSYGRLRDRQDAAFGLDTLTEAYLDPTRSAGVTTFSQVLAPFEDTATHIRSRIEGFKRALRGTSPRRVTSVSSFAPNHYLTWIATAALGMGGLADAVDGIPFPFSEPLLSRESLDEWLEEVLVPGEPEIEVLRAIHDEYVVMYYDATMDIRRTIAAYREARRHDPSVVLPDATRAGVRAWETKRLEQEKMFASDIRSVLSSEMRPQWDQFVVDVRRTQYYRYIASTLGRQQIPELLLLLRQSHDQSAFEPGLLDLMSEYRVSIESQLVRFEDRFFSLRRELVLLRGAGNDKRRDRVRDQMDRTVDSIAEINEQFVNRFSLLLDEAQRHVFIGLARGRLHPEVYGPTPADLAGERAIQWMTGIQDHRVVLVEGLMESFSRRRAHLDHRLFLSRKENMQESDYIEWFAATQDQPYRVWTPPGQELWIERYDLVTRALNQLGQVLAGNGTALTLPADIWFLLNVLQE